MRANSCELKWASRLGGETALAAIRLTMRPSDAVPKSFQLKDQLKERPTMSVAYCRASLRLALPLLALAALAFPARPALATPPFVTTQHNNNLRTGTNSKETILNPATVNSSTFGKLFTLILDASVNGQPLYVPGLTINGKLHNVLFVYTSYSYGNYSPCSVYALDADNPKQTAPL